MKKPKRPDLPTDTGQDHRKLVMVMYADRYLKWYKSRKRLRER